VPTYTVRESNRISRGATGNRGVRESTTAGPGEKIDLTDDEAWDVRHALEDPPTTKPGEEELDPEIALSIRNNPENPESGIELYWKSRADLSVRPDTNKSNQEKALEPARQKAEAEEKAEAEKKKQARIPARPARPDQGLPGGRPAPQPPVVPPQARPQPKG
jgi:hypothetical protein